MRYMFFLISSIIFWTEEINHFISEPHACYIHEICAKLFVFCLDF